MRAPSVRVVALLLAGLGAPLGTPLAARTRLPGADRASATSGARPVSRPGVRAPAPLRQPPARLTDHTASGLEPGADPRRTPALAASTEALRPQPPVGEHPLVPLADHARGVGRQLRLGIPRAPPRPRA